MLCSAATALCSGVCTAVLAQHSHQAFGSSLCTQLPNSWERPQALLPVHLAKCGGGGGGAWTLMRSCGERPPAMRALPLLSIWICCIGRPVCARLHVHGPHSASSIVEGMQISSRNVGVWHMAERIPGCWNLLHERSGLVIVHLSKLCRWHRHHWLHGTSPCVIRRYHMTVMLQISCYKGTGLFSLILMCICTCAAAEAAAMTTSVRPLPTAPGSGVDDTVASGASAACRQSTTTTCSALLICAEAAKQQTHVDCTELQLVSNLLGEWGGIL